MKHKIKILVVAILCAFMVGCAQSEQPVQQDAQTSQTQQSDVKEDTQTAEQTQKETPEEVLQRCTLKGEWSPELTELMETINAEHQAIQKPVFSEEKYAKYFKKRENNTISEKAEPNLDGSLSLAQIESDVNFLFDSLRQNYGLYEYFGGEEVFEPARSRVLEQCKENKQMDASKLETLLVQELSFIEDNHFILGSDNMVTLVTLHPSYFYIEEEYHMEGSQYKTSDGKTIESVEGYKNLDELMKRSLNRQGEIVYYPVVRSTCPYPFSYLTCNLDKTPNNLVVHYTDGTIQELKAEPYQKASNERESRVELYENRQIPIVYSDDMFDSRIIGMGSKLRGQSVSIMDLMTNDGGKPGFVDKWFENYTKQKVTPNQFSIYSCAYQEKDLNPEDIQQINGHTVYQAGEDMFVENEDLLILLTSFNTMSAAEYFTDMAHNVENTLIIGESTFGALRGDIWSAMTTLPYSKIKLNFGQRVFEYPEGYFEEGYGFEPDLWCPAVYAEESAVNFVHRMMK